MARREIQSEGKDVATAIIRGLNELGRRRDQVEVTVIQEEKSGFLGIGGRPAIVRIIEKKWDSEHSTPMKPRSNVAPSAYPSSKGRGRKGRKDFKKGGRKPRIERVKTPKENEPQKLPDEAIQNAIVPEDMKPALQCAKEALNKMVSSMGIELENLNVWWDEKQNRILLTFDCNHPAILIGKEGKTLESVQYLITLLVSRQFNKPISVMADTQNYWRKLEDKINREIDKALSMVKRTKRVYRFRPMPAQMRRYIHRFLADNLEITTVSEGEGKWRKVVIKPEPRPVAETEETAAEFIEQEATATDIAQHSNDESAGTETSAPCEACADKTACGTCPNAEKTETSAEAEIAAPAPEQSVVAQADGQISAEQSAGTDGAVSSEGWKEVWDNLHKAEEIIKDMDKKCETIMNNAPAEPQTVEVTTEVTVAEVQTQETKPETACAQDTCPCCGDTPQTAEVETAKPAQQPAQTETSVAQQPAATAAPVTEQPAQTENK